jgi:hypothetical protein
MVVVAFLRGDLATEFFPFHYGGWLKVLASIVLSFVYAYAQPVTSSTIPSCCFSSTIVCDLSGMVGSF